MVTMGRPMNLGECVFIMLANNSDRWTEDEEERLRQLVLSKLPPFEIAVALGRTVSAVKIRARSLGLALPGLGFRHSGFLKFRSKESCPKFTVTASTSTTASKS